MKRSQDQVVKPYVPKRLRKQQPPPETDNSLEQTNTLSPVISPTTSNQLECKSSNSQPSKYTRNYPCTSSLDVKHSHTKSITRLQWHPHLGDLLVSSSLDKKILLWNCTKNSLTLTKTLLEHDEAVKDVKFSTDGRHLLTASFDKTAKLSDFESGKICFCFLLLLCFETLVSEKSLNNECAIFASRFRV